MRDTGAKSNNDPVPTKKLREEEQDPQQSKSRWHIWQREEKDRPPQHHQQQQEPISDGLQGPKVSLRRKRPPRDPTQGREGLGLEQSLPESGPPRTRRKLPPDRCLDIAGSQESTIKEQSDKGKDTHPDKESDRGAQYTEKPGCEKDYILVELKRTEQEIAIIESDLSTPPIPGDHVEGNSSL